MSARNVHGLIQAQGGRSELEGGSRAGEESRRQKKCLFSSLARRSTYPGQRREIRQLETVTTACAPLGLADVGEILAFCCFSPRRRRCDATGLLLAWGG